MKKNKFLVMLLALSLVLGLCSCTITITTPTKPTKNPVETQQPVESEKSVETPTVQEPVNTPEVQEPVETPEIEEPVETPNIQEPVETPISYNLDISDDWTDLEFGLDGIKYKMNVPYSDLVANGWTFDLKDYGQEEDYQLDANYKVYGTIDLNHSKYGTDYEDFYITVGFINNDTVPHEVIDCDVWTLTANALYGSGFKEPCGNMTIAKGIHFGSTEEEVLAAFGTPYDVYESDLGYKAYTWYEDSKYLDITVYPDKGVTSIGMKAY